MDLNLQEILSFSSGKLLSKNADLTRTLSEFIFDSRKVTKDSIFVCIPGEKVDGHDFIAAALSSGAVAILGESAEKLKAAHDQNPSGVFIEVPSVLKATQEIAKNYRKKFRIPILAVVGSNGKTTTKDFLGAIIKAAGPAIVTEGSLNNHWGVPQTLLRLRKEHRCAVLELGTNHFGEVLALAEISQPTWGVMTSIGKEHVEFLIDEAGSLKANREVLDWMLDNNFRSGFVFNLDDPWIAKLYSDLKSNTSLESVLVSQSKEADLTLAQKKNLQLDEGLGWQYKWNSRWGEIAGKLAAPGNHNLQNAMLAAGIALASGVANVEQVQTGLENVQRSYGRSQFTKHTKGFWLYQDYYNANPSSFEAFFAVAKECFQTHPEFETRLAIVGDMFELGENSEALHAECGTKAAHAGFTHVVAIGGNAHVWSDALTKAGQKNVSAFSEKQAAAEYISNEILTHPKQAIVFCKASRGAKLEEVLAKI